MKSADAGSVLFSLQSKLIAAFVLVMLVAVVLAGTVFVFVQRGEQEEQALDHVSAASPPIYSAFISLYSEYLHGLRQGDLEATLVAFVDVAAQEQEVRILLIDRRGLVIKDSQGDLTGEQITLPREFQVSRTQLRPFRPYVSWRPEGGDPGSDLILISALLGRLGQIDEAPYALVLAVPESTITGAWLGLLPGLGIAAAIALPVAVLLAIVFAGYITRPLKQLTVASQRMAEGNFDVEVSVDRRDEVGRLAQAFSTMAVRVGDAQTQMRTLVADVSHDLKTPLTSVLGFARALRDGTGDEAEAKRLGGVIYDEASRLNARLNDLLYLSELESGQALLQRDEIDLARLVQGVVARIEAEVASRNVRLSVELAEGVTLSADGAKLERAIENLLDNARKYTPAGGEIRVRTAVRAGDAFIEVANTAPDISPEELPRLFERFYRRDRTRGGEGGSAGSGLGLPIASDLIELHGGTLQASVRDGEIVFEARLPLRA
ncbi:MAG: HAMP domain-containing histidine kinase [Chloroflexi bacterium]|nr:HAMP domain-containing histidine kinase [Chloroflexota bacterium]